MESRNMRAPRKREAPQPMRAQVLRMTDELVAEVQEYADREHEGNWSMAMRRLVRDRLAEVR